ncbi:MAG: hypothetical protein KVP17_001141 [Porospora cf. gigantea B]|uniref:uncharacterized protein n=2 Tax=Porospora cf. gigantea B TaxID=2853592 RepID=UPI003571DC79|nr:MAG: hypothetical protein KVP17_001141 [Porospora cf. gigantea B]
MSSDLVVKHKGTPRVSMSNELTRSAHRLSLNEKRIIAYSISKLDSRAAISEAHRRVRIRVKDFINDFELHTDHSLYKKMQKSCTTLMDRKLTLFTMNSRGNKDSIEFRWVDEAIYTEGEGEIELKFSERIAPHLLELSNSFTSYHLAQASGLRSMASWRLLELLMQFKDTKRLRIPIADLHHAMEASPTSQRRFSNFKQSILKPAIAELETQEALKVNMKTILDKRKVIAVEFTFEQCPQRILDI